MSATRPCPGTRVRYRADGRDRTGTVLRYEMASGYTFPVSDDSSDVQRMLLPSEVEELPRPDEREARRGQ